MAVDEPRYGLLRRYRWTIVSILLVTALAVFLLIGAVTVIGMVESGDDDGPEVPATRFSFTEVNTTITDHGGTENRTAVEISYRGGTDVYQGRITVRVNDRAVWDVRETEDGYNASRTVWNDTTNRVSERPARVVVYGDTLDEGDIEREDVSDRYRYLEEGDVIEIVWYADDSETMTVLQRYEVRGTERSSAESS